jgi:endonuclease/exonuclease/phosphatase family metal-dependent hydrolase
MKSHEPYNQTKSATQRVMSGAHLQKPAALLLLIATTLALALPVSAGQPFGPGGKRGVDTMTVNLYIGGGTERILALDPTDPDYINNLIATVTGIYYEILASQPSVRLDGVAGQIAARMPDIVAVQEASLIRNESPGDLVFGGTSPATNVVADYLQILVGLLNARGAHYIVVSSADEIDIELPMLNLVTGTIDDARLTDREAILVRTDLPPGQLRVLHPMSGNFTNVIQIPGVGLSVLRGWCSVDVFIRGRDFRYICVHSEEETAPQIQILQARELLGGPAHVNMPVMICGDFNSDPLHRDGSLAYDTYTAAGFKDAWAVLHPFDPAGGLTWGHDEFLADPSRLFDRRIDLVFYKGATFTPVQADVLDLWLNRTLPPLWSSDHAAVSAEFLLR